MANWKKIIVSGSDAELKSITASGAIRAILPSTSDTSYVVVDGDGDFGKRSLPSIPSAANDATITLTAGDGLKGGGNFTTDQSGNEEITFNIDVDVMAGVGLTADNTNEELDVSAAQTGITSIKNNSLIIGGNSQNNTIDFGTDDAIIFDIDNTQTVKIFGDGVEITGSLDMDSHISTSGFISASGFFGNSIFHAEDPNTGLTFSSDTITIQGNNADIATFSTTLVQVSESIKMLTGKNIEGQLNGSFTGSGASITAGTIAAAAVTVTDAEIIVGNGSNQGASVAMSGDVTLSRTGVATIGADKVSNTKLANMTRGTVKVGGASNAPTDLDAKTSGRILIGDGTDINSVAVSGDVAISADGAVTIQANAVEGSMLNNNAISGQTDIGEAIASTDEILISDAGNLRRSDVSRLTTFLQSALTFTTNTDSDVSVANLKTRLAGGFGSNAVQIGDSNDVVTIGNDLVVTGDLIVSGDTTTLNVANLNVEDKFILLNSGSNSGDGGIIVQTDNNLGAGLGYDDSDQRWKITGEGVTGAGDTAFAVKAAGAPQMLVAVSGSNGAPSGNPTDFGAADATRIGMMVVDTSTEDIYVWS